MVLYSSTHLKEGSDGLSVAVLPPHLHTYKGTVEVTERLGNVLHVVVKALARWVLGPQGALTTTLGLCASTDPSQVCRAGLSTVEHLCVFYSVYQLLLIAICY